MRGRSVTAPDAEAETRARGRIRLWSRSVEAWACVKNALAGRPYGMRHLFLALLLSVSVASAQRPAVGSKWLWISHLDSGQWSSASFDAWLDTTHVERLQRGYIGAWMLTKLAHTKATSAAHLLIDCNRRRFDTDHFYSYDATGTRTHEAVLYENQPKPTPDDVRYWEDIDPVSPSWSAMVALEACRRWSR